VAQGAGIELSQQPFQTVESFGAQSNDSYRVNERHLARLDSESQITILSSTCC
jgi:hypothetical protein